MNPDHYYKYPKGSGAEKTDKENIALRKLFKSIEKDNNTTNTQNSISDLFEEVSKEKEKTTKIQDYKKYSDKLEEKGLSIETKNIILMGLNNYLLNKKITINGKKIVFSKDYLIQNKEKIIQNITNFLITLMNIESYGGKNIENKISSAKGPLQWIDGWKNGKKASIFNRGKGRTSPFETALRRADMFFNKGKFSNFKSQKIPDFIKNTWNNEGKLVLKEFDTEKQIQLWYIDVLMRKGKAKEYLMGIMEGNKWSAIKLYTDIHHTNAGKGTKISMVVKNNFKHLALL